MMIMTLGEAGARGSLRTRRKNNLGKDTNNKAEVYALIKAL
jgi:ribonuclease HI